jgi:hypothetical protein
MFPQLQAAMKFTNSGQAYRMIAGEVTVSGSESSISNTPDAMFDVSKTALGKYWDRNLES